jgi:hypothetical protein
VEHGRGRGYEFLLVEATFAVTLLQVALRYEARHEARHLRAQASHIHNAVEWSLHRLRHEDPRAGRIRALLAEVRWRLEVAGEELRRGA